MVLRLLVQVQEYTGQNQILVLVEVWEKFEWGGGRLKREICLHKLWQNSGSDGCDKSQVYF